MNEDDPVDVVEDFFERHLEEIGTHLLYLRVQAALKKHPSCTIPPSLIIDSADFIGRPPTDYHGLSDQIKTLSAVAAKCNVVIITAQQQ